LPALSRFVSGDGHREMTFADAGRREATRIFPAGLAIRRRVSAVT